VFEHPEEARAIGERAKRDIAERHSPAARVPQLQKLLEESSRAAIRPRRTSRALKIASVGAIPAEERAETLMSRPDPRLPSRFPMLANLWRRIMLRLIRNYWVHEREVDRAMLESIRSSRESLRLEMRGLADGVTERLERLEERIDRLEDPRAR
jgi:hypothetical protein